MDLWNKEILLPIVDQSVSMRNMLLSAQRAAMEGIRARLWERGMKMNLERSAWQEQKELEQKLELLMRYWIEEMQLLREGATPWQIMNRRIPIELRMAYDACGRMKTTNISKQTEV